MRAIRIPSEINRAAVLFHGNGVAPDAIGVYGDFRIGALDNSIAPLVDCPRIAHGLPTKRVGERVRAMATNDDSLAFAHLRTLIAVVETGSQNKAASKLDIVQSTVGKHLSRLDAYFGAALFEPGQGARLTARGKLVEKDARKLLSELERTRARVAMNRPIVRIGFNRASRPLVERALRELVPPRETSAFDVQLFELSSEAQANKLRTGELDVGVCYVLDHLFTADDQIEELKIVAEPYALVLPERAWKQAKPNLRALSSMSYTHVPRSFSRVFDDAERWLHEQGLAPARRIECALATEILAYAGSGRGFGFLPALWSMVPHDGVVFARVANFRPTATIAAYWLPNQANTVKPLLNRLPKVAREGLRGLVGREDDGGA